jgi:hypothetical protein
MNLFNMDEIAAFMGWPVETLIAWAGDSNSVKKYIDDADKILQDQIDVIDTNLNDPDDGINADIARIKNTLAQIVEHVIGGGTIDPETGDIEWVYSDDKIAVGNMNVNGNQDQTGDWKYIKTTEEATSDDIWAA